MKYSMVAGWGVGTVGWSQWAVLKIDQILFSLVVFLWRLLGRNIRFSWVTSHRWLRDCCFAGVAVLLWLQAALVQVLLPQIVLIQVAWASDVTSDEAGEARADFQMDAYPQVQMLGGQMYLQINIHNPGEQSLGGSLDALSIGCWRLHKVGEQHENVEPEAASIDRGDLLIARMQDARGKSSTVTLDKPSSANTWSLPDLPAGAHLQILTRFPASEIGAFQLEACVQSAVGALQKANRSYIVTAGSYYRDTDGDGVADQRDLDDDNDGILDSWEMLNGRVQHSDHDRIRNSRDLESDGDGVPDLWEAFGQRKAAELDANEDYQIDGAVDEDGLPLSLLESGWLGAKVPYLDTDGDNLPDFIDIDDDGDGLLTLAEGGYAQNSDGTGLPDFLDDDDDDDGIATIEENADLDDDGYPDDALDSDLDGLPDYLQDAWRDTDGDGVVDEIDVDDDNDGIIDFVERASARNGGDTDRDGLPDERDADADGDGLPDWQEAGHGFLFADTDEVVWRGIVGVNGLADLLESAPDSGTPNFSPVDSDSDGQFDFQDRKDG